MECDNVIYQCKPRGSFKKENKSIIVGDYVDIAITDEIDNEAVIDFVYEQKNMLIRPSVANITKLILVFSVLEPKLNFYIIDSFLVLAKKNNIDVVICFSKTDLDKEQTYKEAVKIYEDIGYETVEISSVNNTGIEELKSKISGNINVIAGPSGAGKSSLINNVSSDFNQAISSISSKLQKGKNTTTYATLLKMPMKDSYIADTPGFTSIKATDIKINELKDYFVEFDKYSEGCKFKNKCLHENEPSCSIKTALEEGKIYKSRYDSYIRMLSEIKKYENGGRY